MQESHLPAGEPMALDVLQVKQCLPAELPHLKRPSRVTALRAAAGGQRCERVASQPGVMQEVRHFHFQPRNPAAKTTTTGQNQR